MKHISKLLALVLALVMVLSVFAGCNPADPTEPEATKAPSTEQTKAPEQTNAPEEESIFPLKEKKTYTIYVTKSPDWATQKERNLWYQELVERTNVEIEFVGLGTDAYATLNALFVSGDYGHAYIGNVLNDAQVVEAAAGGYLLALDDYLTEDIMPGYVGRGVKEVPGVVQVATTTDGHIYTLPRIDINGYGYNEVPLAVNTEWVKKAGLTDVSTLEKFEQYLKYVKENDMNGNGDPNDEIPFLTAGTTAITQGAIQGIMGWWGLPTKDSATEYYSVITDGKVELVPETEAYRAALTKINEWYEAGYLWAEMYTGNNNAAKALVQDAAIPVVGALNSSAFNIDRAVYGDTDQSDDKNDGVMKFVDPPKVEGYDARLFVNPSAMGYKNCYALTDKCSEEDAKILLAWMDMAMFTVEGTMSSLNQEVDAEKVLEGYTNWWDWNENGRPVIHKLTPEQEDKNYSLMNILYEATGSFCYLTVPSDYDGADAWKTMVARFRELKDGNHEFDNTEVWPRPYMTEDMATEVSYLWPDIKNVITQYETAFVKGELEINDANWQEYMKALYKADSDELVDLLQVAYDATLG